MGKEIVIFLHECNKVSVQVGNEHYVFDHGYLNQICIKLIDQELF